MKMPFAADPRRRVFAFLAQWLAPHEALALEKLLGVHSARAI